MKNGNFDEEQVTSNCFNYKSQINDKIPEWTLSGKVIVVQQSCSAWGGLNSREGINYLALQQTHAQISQDIENFAVGEHYEVSFLVAHRPDSKRDERFAVYVDAHPSSDDELNITQVGSDHPGECLWECAAPGVEDERVITSDGFLRHQVRFKATSTTHKIRIKNTSPSGDLTIFVDDVQINRATYGVLNGGFEYDIGNNFPAYSYSPANRAITNKVNYDDKCYAATNFYKYTFHHYTGKGAGWGFYQALFSWFTADHPNRPRHLMPPYDWESTTDVQDWGNYVHPVDGDSSAGSPRQCHDKHYILGRNGWPGIGGESPYVVDNFDNCSTAQVALVRSGCYHFPVSDVLLNASLLSQTQAQARVHTLCLATRFLYSSLPYTRFVR